MENKKINQPKNETDLNKLYNQMLLLGSNNNNSIDESMHDSVERNINKLKDSYGNSVLGIGNKDKIDDFSEYSFDNNSLNWFLWLALYNESWVFRRVIDKPSQDMIRPGISLIGNCDFEKVYETLDLLKPDLIDLIKWGKLFGGSVMVLLFKGISFDKMEEPMTWDMVKGCKTIKAYVTDRWFGVSPSYDEVVTNLSNEDFGKPVYYTIQFNDGTHHRIHHSWIIRYENRNAPNLVKSGQLQGWGYAEGSHILHELNRDEKLKTSIQSLVDKSLIEIIHMAGMRGVFMGADKGNEEQLRKRLEMVNWARNFNSITLLDKDDTYEQHNFSGLNGLSDILQQNMWQIAAAVEMQGVLFGDLSNGFSRDDSALERYDEKILNDCDTYLRKPLAKLINILFHVYQVTDKETMKIAKPKFLFNSIIAEKKNETLMNELSSLVELCGNLVEQNVITTEQEAKAISEYLNTRSINFEFLKTNTALLKQKEENGENDEFGMDNDEFDMDIGSNRLSRGEERKPMGKLSENEMEEPRMPENAPNEPISETSKVEIEEE